MDVKIMKSNELIDDFDQAFLCLRSSFKEQRYNQDWIDFKVDSTNV